MSSSQNLNILFNNHKGPTPTRNNISASTAKDSVLSDPNVKSSIPKERKAKKANNLHLKTDSNSENEKPKQKAKKDKKDKPSSLAEATVESRKIDADMRREETSRLLTVMS